MTSLPHNFVSLSAFSSAPRELLQHYYKLTREWGERINITANLAPDAYERENILDPSCALLAWQGATNKANGPSHTAVTSPPLTLVDLGCGGGFVGITWHILLDQKCGTLLIDADRKKINFCKQAIREMGLKNISAEQVRLDPDRPKNILGRNFALVVSRATWEAATFFNVAQPLLAPTGMALAFQSEKQYRLYLESPQKGTDSWLNYLLAVTAEDGKQRIYRYLRARLGNL